MRSRPPADPARRVLVLGGGPGGLHAAALLKRQRPEREITVVERNPADATYGWGVVFSEQTLAGVQDADWETHRRIARAFVRWEAIDVRFRDELVRCHGHSFAGIERKELLGVLQERCRELGVEMDFDRELDDFSGFDEYDLVIAADGANSQVRARSAELFGTGFLPTQRKYAWLASTLLTDSMLYSFREGEHGLFLATFYPFSDSLSTCIVECDEDTWRRAGLDAANEEDTVRYCSELFATDLGGSSMLSNRSVWLTFVTISNRCWHHRNVVLVGDAAHTAHYSIGSGTKMAMEDAAALAEALERHAVLDDAFTYYERGREPVVAATQAAGIESYRWFTNLARYRQTTPLQFSFNLLTRSGRIGYDNLRVRDAGYVERIDRWFSRTAAGRADPLVAPPPLFAPQRLRGLTLADRLVLTQIGAGDAEDGLPGEAGAAGLRELARRSPGLVISELVAVSAQGRVSTSDPGLYSDAQAESWSELVQQARAAGARAVGLRLNHAGPRGATRPRLFGTDRPLPEGGWPLLAASAVAYGRRSPVPQAMDRASMDAVRDDFAAAAARAVQAGANLVELWFGHGYLIASFLSPLTNRRDDDFGGPIEHRLRYPLEVLEAVRTAIPAEVPLAVAFSAGDRAAGGLAPDDAVAIARAFAAKGCDLIEVLAGQTLADERPAFARHYLAGLSELVRGGAGVLTLTRGGLTTADDVNIILAAGRADLAVMDPPPAAGNGQGGPAE